MSLQLWLPLTGTLNNNGLADATITNSGATVDAMGKIGSCYSFSGTYLSTNNPLSSPCSQFSVAGWVKLNTGFVVNNGFHIISFQESYNRICVSKDGAAVRVLLNNSGTNIAVSSNALNSFVVAGEWNHYAVVYNAGKIWIYINGQLDAERTVTPTSVTFPNSPIRIGTHSTEVATGCLNDFRLYDHALSAKEVKEISKALIMHMPLDNNGGGKPNLLIDTAKGAGQVKTTYNLWDYNFSQALVNGTTYTITCKMTMTSEKKSFAVYHSGGSIICGNWVANKGDGIYTYSFVANANMASQTSGAGYGYARVYVSNNNGAQGSTALSGSAGVEWIKIEEGSKFTGYCPNTADAAYSVLGFDSNTVYDTSGYCNNGTYSTNRPTPDADSPRYGSCMLFNGSNNFIICGRGSFVRDAITVNFWAYMANWGSYTRAASCTEGGGWNFEPGSGSKMNFAMGTGVSGCTYKSALAEQTFASLSGWVMFTGTYDGFTTKIYINGVLSGTNEAYTTKTPIFYNSANGLFIGAEAGGSPTAPVGSYFNGKISDFRIYATALSAEDIADLYNKPISIDNTGKVFAMDYIEM